MKNRFLTIAPLLITLAGCNGIGGNENNGPGSEDSGPIVVFSPEAAIQGEIIVKMKAGAADETITRAGGVTSGNTQIDRVLMTVGSVSFERLFPSCGRFEARTRKEGLDRWFIAKYDETVPAKEVAEMLSGCDGVEVIEYSIPTAVSAYSKATAAENEEPVATRAYSSARNTPFPFNESVRSQRMQWHYNNTGNVYANSTVVGADADVYAAWQLCTGNPDVIVAVVDQGVKYDHEDLAANMWVNKGEIPDNGIDDDGNGYIDDIHGFNFVDNKGTIVTSSSLSHGTHVAGTIAAVNNNGIGVNGIAGGSGNKDGVRIMTLQTLGASENGSSGSGLGGIVRAMKYAADNGAVICQNSWGYNQKLSWNTWTRSSFSALRRAIDYFVKYAGVDENGEQTGPMKGGIVIFAAGNEAVNHQSFPAADKSVVSVASYSYTGDAAYYTNYGTWVDISAPGGDTYADSNYGGVYSTSVNEDGTSGYEYMQGTSMACPHVSGACALAVSYYYGKDKRMGLTPDMLRSALLSSARPINANLSAPYVGNMGVGMLDTYRLLQYMGYLGEIPAQTLTAGQTKTLEMSEYFPSVQVLSYSVSDPAVVKASLSKGVLTLEGVSSGTAEVTVSDGNSMFKTIKVTVN